MAEPHAHGSPAFPEGSRVVRRVERAAGDLRRGTPVVVHGDDRAILIQAAEIATDGGQEVSAQTGEPRRLVIAAARAKTLGYHVAADVHALEAELPAESADPMPGVPAVPTGGETRDMPTLSNAGPGDRVSGAAIALAKIARLLPVLVGARVTAANPPAWAGAHDLLAVSAGDVAAYEHSAAHALREVASARVPLAGAENARLHAFRTAEGTGEHLAIMIGQPRAGEAVLTRLHSECLTGDLLGSLRCDCGDQLRGAVRAISETGAGVLLYLAQEGRGIGLANKLRAYDLQDRGADTLEANLALGYGADERVYRPAAEMLRQLGFTRIRLLTNNPDKVSALTRHGIAVEARVPHRFPTNDHNAHYMATKARRFGHLY